MRNGLRQDRLPEGEDEKMRNTIVRRKTFGNHFLLVLSP